MSKYDVKKEKLFDQDWLDRLYRRSNSEGTVTCAKTSLTTFGHFCQNEVGLNGKSMPEMIEKYQF